MKRKVPTWIGIVLVAMILVISVPSNVLASDQSFGVTVYTIEPPVVVPDTHKHSYDSVEVVSPTCTEKGYTKHICSCKSFYKTDEVVALGHDNGVWSITKLATFTEEGATSRKCTRCGAVLETKVLPKLTKLTQPALSPTVVYEEPTISNNKVEEEREGAVTPNLVATVGVKKESGYAIDPEDKKVVAEALSDNGIDESVIANEETEKLQALNKEAPKASDWNTLTRNVKSFDWTIFIFVILFFIILLLLLLYYLYRVWKKRRS